MRELQDILIIPLSEKEFYKTVKERLAKNNIRSGVSVKKTTEYICSKFPELKSDTIDKAGMALQGRMVLPGTANKPYFVGNPPDWFDNPVNDKEYVYSLNRMHHWKYYIQAYLLSGEIKYIDKLRQELTDWVQKCKRPPIMHDIKADKIYFGGPNPWRLLEIGIRMFDSWPWIMHYMKEVDLFTSGSFAEFALCIYRQGEVLAEISPVFWPNADHNHYLMESLGLLSIANMFPEFKTAEKWKEQAVRELQRCFEAQLTEEGGQIEGCPGYNHGCIRWFLLAVLHIRKTGGDVSEKIVGRLMKAIDYAVYATRPNGYPVPWGDTVCNQVNPIRTAIYGYILSGKLHWLEILIRLAGREKVLSVAKDMIWEISEFEEFYNKINTIETDSNLDTMPLVMMNKKLKQAAIRSSWSKDALSVFFACRTPVKNAHAHIDPMSFDFTAYGKPLIVDPGVYCYREDENRRLFKSSDYHNTLTIDHAGPFKYISSWSYGLQKEGRCEKLYNENRFMAVEAVHFNYEPTVHRRLIAMVESKFLVILDQLENIETNSSVQIYYHFDSPALTWTARKKSALTANEDVNAVLYAAGNLEGEVLEGRISLSWDSAYPSSRLVLRDYPKTYEDESTRCTERNYAAVIVPFKGSDRIPEVNNLKLEPAEKGISITFESGKMYHIVWSPGSISID